MGFDIGALFAGAASGVAESIETRNKQIRNGAVKQLDQLVSEAETKEKGLRTERDVLSQQARQLSAFRGANNIGLTQDQILGLIQQPETAKALIEELKNKKDLSEVDMSTVFKVGKPGTQMPPEEYIAKKTSIVKPTEEAPAKVVRGAFGLESPAAQQVEAEFEATTGRKASEVRAIARGKVDLGAEFKPMEGTIDLKQFSNPETIANITAKLRDAKAKGENLDSPQNKLLSNKLAANAVIENQFKGDGEGNKPRTAAAINSIVDKSLRVGLGSYEMKGMIRFDPQTNAPVVITGDAKAIEEYNEVKRKVVERQFQELDLIKGGKIVKNQAARDAILPYASIDKEDNVVWRKPDAIIPDTPPPAGPKAGAPSSVTAPVVSDKPLAIPKTSDGKIDGTKLVPGQTYTDAQGKKKTWNGSNWQ